MSLNRLLENKQLVHIGTEVVVLLGITMYFSSKNKQLIQHIENLDKRLEEQQQHIQILESNVVALANLVKELKGDVPQRQKERKAERRVVSQPTLRRRRVSHIPKPQIVEDFHLEDVEEVSEEDQSDHSQHSELTEDLDAELQEELEEMNNSLKKQ